MKICFLLQLYNVSHFSGSLDLSLCILKYSWVQYPLGYGTIYTELFLQKPFFVWTSQIPAFKFKILFWFIEKCKLKKNSKSAAINNQTLNSTTHQFFLPFICMGNFSTGVASGHNIYF